MSTTEPANKPLIGSRRLIGQHEVRNKLAVALNSGRLSHAYLLAGPPGIGKKAICLAFAEAINGVDNLGDLQAVYVKEAAGGESAEQQSPAAGETGTPATGKDIPADAAPGASGAAHSGTDASTAPPRSAKSSWFLHPDIHMFLPIPSETTVEEIRARLEMLSEDPYEVVDFGTRPSLKNEADIKNRNAFYPIDYFRENIKPVTYLKPNEGRKTVVILSNVEKMLPKVGNAFLKLLEEPPEDIVFLLTTDNRNALLSTILSRCQVLSCAPLGSEEIKTGLMKHDGYSRDNAEYLARISGGNYGATRFYDAGRLQSQREEIIQFLRYAYTQDAVGIVQTSHHWQSEYNREAQVGLLNMLEIFLRDIMVYLNTGNEELITNRDKADVIRKFCQSLKDARVERMMTEITRTRKALQRNVQAKYLFTVLANRYSMLMRGREPIIPEQEPWRHAPSVPD